MALNYTTLSMAGFLLAAAFGLLALVFWILFRIPKVYGDVSGRSAKKSMEERRKRKEREEFRLMTDILFVHTKERLEDTVPLNETERFGAW